MTPRRRGEALGLTSALLLLAGCAIPTSSSVETVVIEPEGDAAPLVDVATGPQPGASQQEILQDFLRAGRSPLNRYEVAREYLAEGVEWDPGARTLIYSTLSPTVVIDDDTMSLSPTVVAEVDGGGHYTARESSLELRFDFVEEGGEWRIASAPDGTLVPPRSFSSAFGAYPLYFFDPTFAYLVPDLRWFPVTQAVPGRVVDELLAGASPWLRPAVVSAFPDGLEAEVSQQPPDVTIELGTPAATETPASQRRMIDQLRASLVGTIGNLNSVTVTVAGIPLEPGTGSVGEQEPAVRFPVLAGVDDRIGELTSDGLVSLPGFGERADGLGALDASLSRDRSTLAVLTPAGVVVVGQEGDPVLVDPRPGLAAPSTDPHGWIFSVPRASPQSLQALDGQTPGVPLPIEFGGTVAAIEVSRDGTRLLVALAGGSNARLLVYGIVRDADLAPTALSTPLEIELDDDPVDVAWVDGDTVAVLEISAVGSTGIKMHDLGGPVTDLGTVPGAVQIVGGNNGENGLRVLTAEGEVLRRGVVDDWVNTGLSASFLGTQQ